MEMQLFVPTVQLVYAIFSFSMPLKSTFTVPQRLRLKCGPQFTQITKKNTFRFYAWRYLPLFNLAQPPPHIENINISVVT